MPDFEEQQEITQDQLDQDATDLTGEGMTVGAFIKQQKEARAAEAEKPKKTDPEKPAEKTAAPEGETSQEEGTEKSSEEKTADAEGSTSQESETPPELTIDKVKEVLGESGLEDLQTWKKAFEDREKWNSTLSKKASAIPFLGNLTPEQWEVLSTRLLPYVHGKESVPETPEAFINEAVESLNGEIPESIRFKYTDPEYGDEKEIDIPKDAYLPLVKKAAGELMKRSLSELPGLREKVKEMTEEREQLQKAVDDMTRTNGYLVLESFFQAHPEHAPQTVSENESPVDALFRIGESGEDHPEYGKFLKFESAATLSQKRNIRFVDAWDTLYGAEERKVKRDAETKKKIIENQEKKEAGERGGEAPTPDPLEKQKKRVPVTYQDMVERMFD